MENLWYCDFAELGAGAWRCWGNRRRWLGHVPPMAAGVRRGYCMRGPRIARQSPL